MIGASPGGAHAGVLRASPARFTQRRSGHGRLMPDGAGHRRWAIAEGYIPSWSNGPEPEMTSHETACILNTGDRDAHVTITVYFKDREPAGPYEVTVPARRTLHQRFNELGDPPVPHGVEYASLIESDVPVVVQHTRLDSRQSENALISTIAHPLPEEP
jgi:hypothetical protein